MKVLFVSTMYSRPGGDISAAFVHRQVLELVKIGLEVQVVCPTARHPRLNRGLHEFWGKQGTVRSELDGIPITWLPYWHVLPVHVAPRLGAQLLRHALLQSVRAIRTDVSFDLIHAHRLYPVAYAALDLARRCGVPLVASARGSDVHTHPARSRGIAEITRVVIESSDQVVTVSEALAENVRAMGQPKSPIQVVYNGVDVDVFRPARTKLEVRRQLGLPLDGLGLATVGRLVRGKGIPELLDAFEHLAAEDPQCWLVIVGDGPFRLPAERHVAKASIAERVFFVGARPHEEVPAWLSAADVFVLASHNEGLPNVVLEAMACALPVVVTDVGGVREVVRDGVEGFLVQPKRGRSLVQPLRYLVDSASLRSRMGSAGRSRVAERFSWESSAVHLSDVYRGVLDGRSGRTAVASDWC